MAAPIVLHLVANVWTMASCSHAAHAALMLISTLVLWKRSLDMSSLCPSFDVKLFCFGVCVVPWMYSCCCTCYQQAIQERFMFILQIWQNFSILGGGYWMFHVQNWENMSLCIVDNSSSRPMQSKSSIHCFGKKPIVLPWSCHIF